MKHIGDFFSKFKVYAPSMSHEKQVVSVVISRYLNMELSAEDITFSGKKCHLALSRTARSHLALHQDEILQAIWSELGRKFPESF